MVGMCEARMRENEYGYKYLVGRPERKKQLSRSRSSWNVNIVMDLKVVCDGIGLLQDRV
jgi:hypothetical protein